MTRKTSSLKSRTTSSKTLTGKKETSSRGQSKATKSSSRKSKTQQCLKNNLSTLTTSSEKKSKSTSTAKAKAKSTKTTTKSTTSTSQKQQKKPSVKRTTRQKRKETGIKIMNSRKLEFFPHIETFPIFLQDLTENKRCWFTCVEHAQKYIDRYQHQYKCYQYTGK